MSPRRVENEELYHDRTVQGWHRDSFPDSWTAIDLDLMGACQRCRRPLYLIESTTNPNKYVGILTALAQRSDVPAFIVYHNTSEVTGGKVIYPHHERCTPDRLIECLTNIRRNHRCAEAVAS